MYIYLVQHGEAKPEDEDPEKRLSEKGKKDVEAVAKMVSSSARLIKIYHSGKARARETAEIFSKYLNSEVEQIDGLKPLDNPTAMKKFIELSGKDLMLVGHLPHLSKLTSLLITGNSEKAIVSFNMGGVVALKKDGESFLLEWAVIPSLLK